MSELIFLLSLAVTGLLILCVVFYDFYRRESSFLGSYVCFFLLLSYVFVPLLIFYSSTGVNVYFLDDLDFFKSYFSISSAVVLVFFCSFFLGYFLPSGRGAYYIYFAVPSPSRFVVVLFLISFVAFFFFVYMYGGLGYVLANASQIRSGTDPNKSYVGAFAKMFSYYIEVVVFFVFARLLTGHRWRWVLIFLVVLCVALFKSFIDAGRGGLLNIIVGLFFVYVFIKSRFPFLLAMICIPIFVFIVVYGKIFIFQIFGGAELVQSYSITEKVDVVFSEFSHRYLSIVTSVVNGLSGDRMFSDFVIWVIKPLKLAGFEIEDSISYYNTYHINGNWDSEIPPGIVALFLYNGGVLGIVLGGFLSGFVLRRIDGLIVGSLHLNARSPISCALFSVFCLYIPFAYGNSDPALFIQWCFVYLVLFLIMFFMRYLRIVKVL